MALKRKKPWLAAILNIIILGLGYIYIGVKRNFAILLIIGVILSFFVKFDLMNLPTKDIVLFLSIGIIFSIAFGYDAYQEAIKYNLKNKLK